MWTEFSSTLLGFGVRLNVWCVSVHVGRASSSCFVPVAEKWMKQNKLDFLGIPSCVGFGLHADSYRFVNLNSALIFHVFQRLELYPADSVVF